MPVPKFTARSYFNAAQEHLARAARLREQQQYFAAHYFAGVAVEAILRCLGAGKDDAFDSTHDIAHWAKKANLLPDDSDKQNEFRAKLTETNLRWRANQRYYTDKMLDTWLHHINIDGKMRGDRVKPSSERMLNMANDIVTLGVIRWNKKS